MIRYVACLSGNFIFLSRMKSISGHMTDASCLCLWVYFLGREILLDEMVTKTLVIKADTFGSPRICRNLAKMNARV